MLWTGWRVGGEGQAAQAWVPALPASGDLLAAVADDMVAAPAGGRLVQDRP